MRHDNERNTARNKNLFVPSLMIVQYPCPLVLELSAFGLPGFRMRTCINTC